MEISVMPITHYRKSIERHEIWNLQRILVIGPENDFIITAFEVYASLALEQFEKAVVNFVSVVEIINTLRS